MKFSKKLMTAAITASMIFGTAATAFAATEADVIAALKAANMPATYITQAQNYLKSNNITAAQADTVIAKIQHADSIMDAAGVTDVTKLTDAQKSAIISDIQSAGSAIGLTITVTKEADGDIAFTAKDASGNTVATFASNQVKQTGSNNTVLAVGAFLLVAAAGSAFAVRRKVLA